MYLIIFLSNGSRMNECAEYLDTAGSHDLNRLVGSATIDNVRFTSYTFDSCQSCHNVKEDSHMKALSLIRRPSVPFLHPLRSGFWQYGTHALPAQTPRRFNHDVASRGKPFRLAVLGSGPAGFYTAYKVMSSVENAVVDMYEQLPVPFGLVRFGVAPDHPDVKVCPYPFLCMAIRNFHLVSPILY